MLVKEEETEFLIDNEVMILYSPGILLTMARAFSARFSTRWVPLPTLYLFSF
jgi:hypothetical protein